jgi:hypothetical protein
MPPMNILICIPDNIGAAGNTVYAFAAIGFFKSDAAFCLCEIR